jgi:uncharacterized protein YprB with RNaseH-like and TPR domain
MNIHKLTVKETKARLDFRCSHGHNGMAHVRCFETEKDIPEKVAIVDIETTGFTADANFAICYCIKPLGGKVITRTISLNDLYYGKYDLSLVKQFIEDIKEYDRLILHYGENGKFDLPFMRTRAVIWELDFPRPKTILVSDTYPILKDKFKLWRNSLKMACRAFDIPAKQHGLDARIWTSLATGNPKIINKALRWTEIHCKEDVESTEKLWNKIAPYHALGRKGI